MSYDIYCYKSPSGTPNPDEVDAIIDVDEDVWRSDKSVFSYREQTVSLLKACNSRLMVYEWSDRKDERPSRKTIRHIELNPPEGDPVIQITVYDNHVFFSIPYWYTGAQAERVMEMLKLYIKALRIELGYLVYDPQTGEAFDPAENDFNGLAAYLKVSSNIDDIVSGSDTSKSVVKPWWKFWA